MASGELETKKALEAGELETKKALEEVQVRNIKAIIEYTESSRKLVRVLEDKLSTLQNQVTAQAALLEQFKIQLAGVQTKVYRGGTG